MTYGLCQLIQIPMRRGPVHSGEMISQLLFGEDFEILEEKKEWLRVRCLYDNTVGWIEKKMASVIDEEYFNQINNNKVIILNDAFNKVRIVDYDIPVILSGGSRIPNPKKNKFELNGLAFELEFDYAAAKKDQRKNVVDFAKSYLHSPYLWGGRSSFGIDCSGFVQVVHKMIGVPLPRNSAEQVNTGTVVNFLEESNPGDLAFFDRGDGHIMHVGILLSKDKIIHASGQVRIDAIDHQGIFNNDLKKYTHKLRVVKQIL